MKLNEDKFPILECIERNFLNDKINVLLEKSSYIKDWQDEIRKSFVFFKNKELKINYVSKSIHEKLIDTNNFIKAKELLKNSPTTTGLLLLPETLLSDFSNGEHGETRYKEEDYPINAILYSWIEWDEHDKIAGDFDEEDAWENTEDRELLILPIFNDEINQASELSEMRNSNETYGWEYTEREGRAWYGKVLDYVMSFILFYNYTETEIKHINAIDSEKQRRVKLNGEKFINYSKNDIEIVDSNYFTKIIRTGEFGVSGHFRVQPFGKGNAEHKIIFIDDYKKNGYTRIANKDRK